MKPLSAYLPEIPAPVEEAETAPDPQADARALDRWLAACGFGARYRTATWEAVEPPEFAERLRAYCCDLGARLAAGDGLLIGGGMGVGKTRALALIAGAAMNVEIVTGYVRGDDGLGNEVLLPVTRPPEVRYVFAPNLYQRMFDRTDEARADVADWETCDLLLLDDFDRIHLSGNADWLAGRVESFAEARYANLRSTVVTLNNAAPLEDARLARTVDRWAETLVTVMVRGESRRAPKALYTEPGE